MRNLNTETEGAGARAGTAFVRQTPLGLSESRWLLGGDMRKQRDERPWGPGVNETQTLCPLHNLMRLQRGIVEIFLGREF